MSHLICKKIFSKKILILVPVYIFAFIIGDIVFSNFFYTKPVKYGCMKKFEYFYELEKNCKAYEKLIGSVSPYKVYTDNNGYRYSGKKRKQPKENIVVFLGDSFSYGWALDYEKSFVGMVERNQEKYFINNLSVPSYSPTVYLYQIKKIQKNKIYPKKIFLVLDLTDPMNEAHRWKKNSKDQPTLFSKAENKKRTKWKDFKRENLKGTRLLSMHINSFIRKIKYNLKNKKNLTVKPPTDSFWADFIHTDWSNLNQDEFWLPYGIEGGLKRIEEKIYKISTVAKKMNSEFYIVIYPWADTLQNGQKYFNWENFANKICKNSYCKGLINTFPDFKKYKSQNKNWAKDLYLIDDPHLNEKGHKLVAEKILKHLMN